MSSTKFITQKLQTNAPVHRVSDPLSDNDPDSAELQLQSSLTAKKDLSREEVLALMKSMQPGSDHQPN